MSALFSSLRMRILLGYLAILLTTLLAAMLLTQANQRVQHQVEGFINHTLPATEAVNQIQLHTKDLVMAGFSLYGLTLSGETFAQQVSALNIQIIALDQKLSERWGDPALSEAARAVHDHLARLHQTMTGTKVDWDVARIQLGELDAAAQQLSQISTAMGSNIRRNATDNAEQIASLLQRGQIAVWVLLAVLALLTFSAFLLTRKQVELPIVSLAKQLNQTAQHRDLRHQFSGAGSHEIQTMAASINGLIRMFQAGMHDVAQAVQKINLTTCQLGQSTGETASSVHKLQADIDTLNQIIQNLESALTLCAQDCESAAISAAGSAADMQQNKEQVAQTATSIHTLAADIHHSAHQLLTLQDAGNQVADVVSTIAEIAAQTNLLALNAAIEAARAGESGRGFAVVADEVRTLSVRTHESTVEINSMLANIVDAIQVAVTSMRSNQQNAQRSVELTTDLVTALDTTKEKILSLADASHQVAQAVSRSSRSATDVRLQVQAFKELGNTVSAGKDQVVQVSGELAQLADSLSTSQARFKL